MKCDSAYFIDTQVWIGRDDGSARKVDTLSREITSEAALLSFEPLAEASDRFLTLRPCQIEKIATRGHEQTIWSGIPGVSLLMYMATETCKNSHCS